MHKVTYIESKKFSLLSKDKNLIHLNNNFASKFFFKKPIAHGVNVVLLALKKYLNLKKDNIFIYKININFKNFIYLNEPFQIKVFQRRILIFNNLNNKIEILIKKKIDKNKNLKNNSLNLKLKKHLISISKIIGSIKPGNGALIHKIECEINKKNFEKKKYKFNKIVKNIWTLDYYDKYYKSSTLTSKSKFYNNKVHDIKLSRTIKKKIYKKKILIIGPSSDIACQLTKNFKKEKCLLYFYSFKIDETSLNLSKKEKKKILKFISKTQPNYIFYLSSPRIYHEANKSKKLLRLYKIIYCDFFTVLLNALVKLKFSAKIFYPSSIALNQPDKYKYLSSYISAKKSGENICKNIKYKKFVKYYRLPQFKTRSNYNILGYYEGKNLSEISKYLEKFFKN
jgi:hypothetical protein